MCCHVLVTPLMHLPLLEKGIIELRNGNICVIHNLSDLLKSLPRDGVVDANEGAFFGGEWYHSKRSPLQIFQHHKP